MRNVRFTDGAMPNRLLHQEESHAGALCSGCYGQTANVGSSYYCQTAIWDLGLWFVGSDSYGRAGSDCCGHVCSS